ncbi:MAG: AI-2E family transporter [Bacteroidota bacterium]|nr:AI-2E family transporter [Bacteroidota bacterium]
MSFLYLGQSRYPSMRIANYRFIYLIIIALTLLLLGWLFFNIVLYFVLSLVLATILRPLTSAIRQTQIFSIRVPRIIAVLLSYIVFFCVLSLFIILFIPVVSEQIQILSNMDYNDMFERVTGPFARLEGFLIENNLTSESPGFIINNIRGAITRLISSVNFSALLNSLISFTGSFFIGVMAVFFISFFLLYEKGILRKQLLAIIPNQYFEVSIGAIYKIEKLLSGYLLGLMFQMLAIFTIASLGLVTLDVNYALTIAVFAALANLIPYAGPILGASFGLVVGVSTGDFSMDSNEFYILLIKIIAVFATVQIIDNIVLQPWIFSKSVKAHPLEIFVIIFVGATLGGIVGMVAAIPAYTLLRVSFLELYKGYKEYYIFKT